MAADSPQPQERVDRHKDGSLRARGQTFDGTPVGYWEWFRRDGTKLRSGHFDEHGQPTGEWITYDQQGRAYKVTRMRPGPTKPAAQKATRSAG